MPQLVDTWDSRLAGALWDSGLQWDVNTGPSPGDPLPYLNLVTSEHRSKPNFIEALTTLIQPLADLQVVLASMGPKYDLDLAIASQLDTDGLWIGVTRNIQLPITNVFFSFDTVGLGFDEGSWWSPINPRFDLIVLSDQAYRQLLRARALNNQWDGTIPGAYLALDTLYAGRGLTFQITDNQNMTMTLAMFGPPPDAVTLALFTGGYINLRPAGVAATYLPPP